MTTAAKPLPAHGTISRRKYHGCTCDTCREGYRQYQRNMRRKKAEGTWQPLVDATPAREHLRALMEGGLPYRQIAAILGVDWSELGQIVYQHKKSSPRRRIRPAIAQRILAIPLGTEGEPFLIDAFAARRRIQALGAMGWPQSHIAPRAGWEGRLSWITNDDQITVATAAKVAKVYDRLRILVPENHGVPAISARRARLAAARRGWASPIAWDGDIDDPNAEPDLSDEVEQQRTRDQLAADRRDEIEHLTSFGVGEEEIAARLGMAVSTVHAICVELRSGRRRDRAVKRSAA